MRLRVGSFGLSRFFWSSASTTLRTGLGFGTCYGLRYKTLARSYTRCGTMHSSTTAHGYTSANSAYFGTWRDKGRNERGQRAPTARWPLGNYYTSPTRWSSCTRPPT